jgi:hypothetical protein
MIINTCCLSDATKVRSIIFPDLLTEWPWDIPPCLYLTVVGNILNDLTNALVVGEIFLVRQFVAHPQCNDDGDGNPDGETEDVERSMHLVLDHIAKRSDKVTPVHCKWIYIVTRSFSDGKWAEVIDGLVPGDDIRYEPRMRATGFFIHFVHVAGNFVEQLASEEGAKE